jgi:hypothetical protein
MGALLTPKGVSKLAISSKQRQLPMISVAPQVTAARPIKLKH